MNHLSIYNTIIVGAQAKNRLKLKKNQKDYVYYEKHHIIPKCLGGTDESDNLVLLTAREHFICHKLLTYIYSNNRKIALAFHKMAYGNHSENYNVTSRDYQYAKELISAIGLSTDTKKKIGKAVKNRYETIGCSDETRKKLSNAIKGRKAPNKGKKMSLEQRKKLSISHKEKPRKISKETRQKMSESAKKRPQISEETRKKMSEAKKNQLNPMSGKIGINNPNYGKKRTYTTKEKISISNKGKKRTPEQIEKYKLINKGKKHSIETKNKIRTSLKGKSRGPYKKHVF